MSRQAAVCKLAALIPSFKRSQRRRRSDVIIPLPLPPFRFPLWSLLPLLVVDLN